MRTIKELLQLMLDNKQYFAVSLCYWTSNLCEAGVISAEESGELRGYIHVNRPSKFSSIEAFKRRNSSFYWTPGNIKPRIRWLKKHISKHS